MRVDHQPEINDNRYENKEKEVDEDEDGRNSECNSDSENIAIEIKHTREIAARLVGVKSSLLP